MSNQKLVQLGAQWCITSDATIYSGDASLEKPLLFDAVRKTTDPDNFYYVHTTVHLNPNREMGKDNKKQMAFQGEDVLDRSESPRKIFADQVIIREPLRFPRTEVKFYGRELMPRGSTAAPPYVACALPVGVIGAIGFWRARALAARRLCLASRRKGGHPKPCTDVIAAVAPIVVREGADEKTVRRIAE